MLITVVGSTATQTMQGALTVQAKGAHITALDNTATVTPEYGTIPVDTTEHSYVTTINGIAPNSQGMFFLSGSACDSWDYIVDGGTPGITLVDLCPACTDCELLYRLKQEVIRMKLWLAVLRDVSLYQGGDELREAGLLWQHKFPPMSACGDYLLGDDFDTFAKDEQFTKGLQLIQQYMTTVHMWNYLVNRNNKSDVISISPEDTAGFVVQTKRSVTSCNEQQTIQCHIAITDCIVMDDEGTPRGSLAVSPYVGNDVDPLTYPVSVLIPRAVVEFIPFEQEKAPTDTQLNIGIPVVGTTAGITSNMRINTAEETRPAYERSVQTVDIAGSPSAEMPVIAAGTYAIIVKFLPFINSVMLDEEDKPISLRGTTASSVTGQTVGNSLVFNFFKEDTAPTYLVNPTVEQYLNAKTAPTVSVNFKLLWCIDIKWAVTDSAGNVNEEQQSYRYLCNGVRRYYSSSVLSGSTINISGETTTEVTNA